jgi:hypothetical protein
MALVKVIEYSVTYFIFFEGLKQSHAPAVARKVLLSITSWHPQNNLDNVLHPSQIQDQMLKLVAPQPSRTRTGQETSKVPVASPPVEFPRQRKPPPGGPAASPETAVHPANHGKDHGVPVAVPSKGIHHHSMPVNKTHGKTHGPPVVAPAKRKHPHSPANNTYVEGPAVSPSKSPIIHRKRHGIPVAAPPKEHSSHSPPANRRHHKGTHLLKTQMKIMRSSHKIDV